MTKFEDNLSPYLTEVEQGSTPANPASGNQKLFIRTSDHLLCYVNSSGTVTPVSSGGVSVTTKGDLQGFSSVAARIPVGSDTQVLTADSSQTLGLKWAAPAAGHTVVLDTFNRADGAVGHASGAGGQLWDVLSGTWAISSNTLTETGGGAERFIYIGSGPATGKRTLTWVLNNKGSGGDGGLVWRAWPVASSNTPNSALLLNIEVTYKLYTITNGATYTAVTIVSGSAATPANGDSIVITDDGYEVTVTVNGGSPVTYTTLQGFTVVPNGPGAFVGFRASSSTGIKHDSITVVDL